MNLLKMLFFKKNNKGFSLIELMVVLVLLSIIILGLVTFFSGGVRSWITGQSQLRAQREARMSLDMMVKEIRLGSSVTKNSDYSITINVPSLGSNSAYDVTFSWSNISGDPLNRTVNGVTNQLLEDIENINFDVVGTKKVEISVQMDLDNDNNPDIDLYTEAFLRNS